MMCDCQDMDHGKGHGNMGCECGCCCCNPGRRFYTKAEKIQMLEDYKTWLEKEKQGVEERIEELKKST